MQSMNVYQGLQWDPSPSMFPQQADSTASKMEGMYPKPKEEITALRASAMEMEASTDMEANGSTDEWMAGMIEHAMICLQD